MYEHQRSGSNYEQQLSALEKANRSRSMRKRVKEDLVLGVVTVKDLLHDPPEIVLGMPIFKLLKPKGHHGRGKKAKALLKKAGCTEITLVGQITERQKKILFELL